MASLTATATAAIGRTHPPTFSPLDQRLDLDGLADCASRGDVLALLRRSDLVARQAEHVGIDASACRALDELVDAGTVPAIAAIEVLGRAMGPLADDRLVELLASSDPVIRRHASWRLLRRVPLQRAIPSLVHLIESGGIDTLHAHRTLRGWGRTRPDAVIRSCTTALAVATDAAVRARLVDLIGVVSGRRTDEILVDLAIDPGEPEPVRIAAVAALSERHGPLIAESLDAVARNDDLVGAHAALALQPVDGLASERAGRSSGLRIAQLVLADGLDGQLSQGGRGDTGGVASLLVSLGNALGRHPDVDHVVTIARGSVHDALVAPLVATSGPWSFGTIAFGDPARRAPTPGDAWEHLPAIERGVRRALRSAGPIDVLHLRMADAGTLAGAEVAASLGIPICFSLAPDPHNVIESLRARGELDIDRFVDLEADQHLWFRARLVERLGRQADRLALFPRSRSFDFFDDLAIDPMDDRTSAIAEGIDLATIRRAEDERDSLAEPAPVLRELEQLIPTHRRQLPLLVSVGRLHPVKGMERVTAAWATDPVLRERCNLVVVGGDLERPTTSERAVLRSIDAAVDTGGESARDGIVLIGGRPHADIARLLVAASEGQPGAWAPGGVYVDGALKEEFGLAVLEAMAAGLVVVAPSTGGPSTYVDHGDTGVLVEPDDDLAEAIRAAFDLVGVAGRRRRARSIVEDRYSVDTMAQQLVELYEPVAA